MMLRYIFYVMLFAQEAVKVTTNRSMYSEESIGIDLSYSWDHCNLTIESSNFAFKKPNVCNATSSVSADVSTHSTSVSFLNCGDIAFNFSMFSFPSSKIRKWC